MERGCDQEPEALEQAAQAVRGVLGLAAEAYERAAAAHDDLAETHEAAARAEVANRATEAAQARRRSAKKASNEATADRARAKGLTRAKRRTGEPT